MATTRTTSNQPLEPTTTPAIDAAVDTSSRAAEEVAGNIPDRSGDVAPVLDAVVAGQGGLDNSAACWKVPAIDDNQYVRGHLTL